LSKIISTYKNLLHPYFTDSIDYYRCLGGEEAMARFLPSWCKLNYLIECGGTKLVND
jgi:hypothetical protein